MEKILKYIMDYSNDRNVKAMFRPVDIWGIHNIEITLEKNGILDAFFINPESFNYDSVVDTVTIMIDRM